MRAFFLGQPFGQSSQLGIAIQSALEDPAHREFWAVSAWAKASGLSRLGESVRRFRERGGATGLILGLDEGGGTWEGLQLAQQIFERVFVFHDPGPRTFHPKLYLVRGAHSGSLILGSGNLTKGGLYTNFEAALRLDLELSLEPDRALLREAENYRDQLLQMAEACLPLDETLMERLREDSSLRISSERRNRHGTRSRGALPSIFGRPIAGLAHAPAPSVRLVEAEDEDVEESDDISAAELREAGPVDELRETGSGVTSRGEPESGHETEEDEGAGVLGFWKALSRWDVSLSSAPGQIIIPIRFLDFFGELEVEKDETADGGVRQSARTMPVQFTDGSYSKLVAAARVILYEPAEHHPRPNVELRFTFHDREVFTRLHENDTLVFSQNANTILVERRESGSMGSNRFGSL